MMDILTNLRIEKHIKPKTYNLAGKATGQGSIDLINLNSQDADHRA